MKSEKEILDALHILQDVCGENNGRCRECILRNADDECGILADSAGEYYEKISEWNLKNNGRPRLILN